MGFSQGSEGTCSLRKAKTNNGNDNNNGGNNNNGNGNSNGNKQIPFGNDKQKNRQIKEQTTTKDCGLGVLHPTHR